MFVPAAGEDRFKFFHRSFFEYFYAQYIFLRVRGADEEYNLLQEFDVDSEVFELTLAMMKQKDELRYQELIEYIFKKSDNEITEKRSKLIAFNILTLGMQVVDDNVYICKYVKYLIDNCEYIIKNIKRIPNQGIIYNIISSNNKYIKKIINTYEFGARCKIITAFLEDYDEIERLIDNNEFQKSSQEERKNYARNWSRYIRRNSFYMKLYIENVDYSNIFDNLRQSDFEELLLRCRITKKYKDKYLKLYSKYLSLDIEKRKKIQQIMLRNPNE